MRNKAAWMVGLLAMVLNACGGGSGSSGGGQSGGTAANTVLNVTASTVSEGAVAVMKQTPITLTFDAAVGASAENVAAVSLGDGSATVRVNVSASGRFMKVTPSAPLKLRTTYTLTIKAGLKADNGAQLARDYTLSFKTVAALFEPKAVVPAVLGFRGSFQPLLTGGDLNGDGRVDIVQVGRRLEPPASSFIEQGYTMLIYHQSTSGVLEQAQRIDHVIPNEFNSVYFENLLVLDIDGDDRPEILVSQHNPGDAAQTGLKVFKRDSAGLFKAHAFIAGPYFQRIRVVDLDGDGRLDLLGNYLRHHDRPRAELRAYLNRATGLEAMAPVDLQLTFAEIALGDLDRDGRVDVLVNYPFTMPGSQARQVLSQTAAGVFQVNDALTQVVASACAGLARCSGPTLLDIDGDGWLDLLWSSTSDSAGTWSTAFVRLPGSGFVQGFQTSYGLGLSLFTATDIDLDGVIDLLIINNLTLGAGLGQRRPEFEYAPAFAIPVVASTTVDGSRTVLDFNGDGRPDVLVSSPDSGVVLMLNVGN